VSRGKKDLDGRDNPAMTEKTHKQRICDRDPTRLNSPQ